MDHVQANPASDEFLIPLQIEIEPRDGVRIGDPRYPPGEAHRLGGTDSDLLIYDGAFELSVPIMADVLGRAGRVCPEWMASLSSMRFAEQSGWHWLKLTIPSESR